MTKSGIPVKIKLDDSQSFAVDENGKMHSIGLIGVLHRSDIRKIFPNASFEEQLKLCAAIGSAGREFTILPHMKYRDFTRTEKNLYGWLSEELFERCGKFNFRSKQDVSPARAIEALFAGTEECIIDCTIAVSIIYYKGLLDYLKEDAFNRKFASGITLTAFLNQKTQINVEFAPCVQGGSEFVKSPYVSLDKAIVGDWMYISNVKHYRDKHNCGDLSGFNVVYLGRNQDNEPVFASLFDNKVVHTYGEILEMLVSGYNAKPLTMPPSLIVRGSQVETASLVNKR